MTETKGEYTLPSVSEQLQHAPQPALLFDKDGNLILDPALIALEATIRRIVNEELERRVSVVPVYEARALADFRAGDRIHMGDGDLEVTEVKRLGRAIRLTYRDAYGQLHSIVRGPQQAFLAPKRP